MGRGSHNVDGQRLTRRDCLCEAMRETESDLLPRVTRRTRMKGDVDSRA